MRQIERKEKLRQVSRLNRLVLGVAVLWLVTSVLLLVISGLGSARSNHNQPNSDRTRKDVHRQLFARVEHHIKASASFMS
jgi:Na+-transporting methylmalonyl-CoA/oxaloacetate decarboxylase gamma subunit